MLVTLEQRRFTRMMGLQSPMIKSSDAIRILNISKQQLMYYRKEQILDCIETGGKWLYFLHSLQRLKRDYLNLSHKEKLIVKRCMLVKKYEFDIKELNQLSLETKLNRRVETLAISTRLKKCLLRDNLLTLKDVVKRSKNEYLKTPNLGRKSVYDLMAFLNNIGLSLDMEFND